MNKRSERIHITISHDEKRQIESFALSWGMAISTFLRYVALRTIIYDDVQKLVMAQQVVAKKDSLEGKQNALR
jgi:hypothetical protein